MKRSVAMLAAIVVLLLLASGFMAADNIRLSGEKAALTEEFNKTSYEYSVLYRQLQSANEQIVALTAERDDLVRELQDYQPGLAPEATDEKASSAVLSAEEAVEEPAEEPIAEDTPPAPLVMDETPLPSPVPPEENIFANATETPVFTPECTLAPWVAETGGYPEESQSSQLDFLAREVALLKLQVEQLASQLRLIQPTVTEIETVLPEADPQTDAPTLEETPSVTYSPEELSQQMKNLLRTLPGAERFQELLQHMQAQ